MGSEPRSLQYLVENVGQERDAWGKFGIRLMVVAGLLGFCVWATVRGHPEQDLPLWPAWIFAALTGLGFGLTIATVLHLGPFRAPTPQRNT